MVKITDEGKFMTKGLKGFQKGNNFIFKKGQIPWNKDTKIDKNKYPNYGHLKKHTKKSKEKMSDIHKIKLIIKCNDCGRIIGNKNHICTTIVPWNKGIPRSEKLKNKQSETMKQLYHDNKIIHWSKGKKIDRVKYPNFGHFQKHTDGTKKILSEFYKGKHLSPKTEFKKGCIPWSKGKKCPKISGENHYKWTGGTRYKISPIEWYTIRQLILERDNFKCQSCGKTHHETILHIHHIIPYKISKNNNVENLITLCVSCHIKTEAILIKEYRGVHHA